MARKKLIGGYGVFIGELAFLGLCGWLYTVYLT